jgi:hypothetical protein
MTLLITAKEIINKTGIRSNTDTGLMNVHVIDSVQEEYIRPVLGKDLYDLLLTEVEACVFTGMNEELWKDYVKPVLAHYVWRNVLPQIHIQTTNAGLQINNSEFSNGATDQQRADLATSVEDIAGNLCEKMTRYLEDNSASFGDWRSAPGTAPKNSGGIIL